MWELYWIVVNSNPFLFFSGFSVIFPYIPCHTDSSKVSSTSQLFHSIKLSLEWNCSAAFPAFFLQLVTLSKNAIIWEWQTFHYVLRPSCCCQHYNNSIFIGFLLPLRIACGILKENGLFEGFRTVSKWIWRMNWRNAVIWGGFKGNLDRLDCSSKSVKPHILEIFGLTRKIHHKQNLKCIPN